MDLFLPNSGIPFSGFLSDFLNSKTMDLALEGKIDVNVVAAVGKLSLSGLLLNAAQELEGMNGFSNNVTVLGFTLPRNDPVHLGIVIELATKFVNPSLAAMKVGTTTLDVFYEGEKMGQITAKDMDLLSGVNFVNFTGLVSPPPSSLKTAGFLFTRYFSGQDSVIEARGVSTESNIGWLRETVKDLRIETVLPGLKNYTFARLRPQTLNISFSEEHDPWIDGFFAVDIILPFTFEYSVKEVSMVAEVYYLGAPFALLSMDTVPCTFSNGTIHFNFTSMERRTKRGN
eukprot:TRINITY_DN3833_c0_g1_i3.p1 TRINITY_DN3833_c0_g1~~TRINITY_DN3833_c0_g1_i3.p1  ORF type:complete len:329 (-),score=81.74 TRINITY_DN3833_c0_g1_i3:31-888(-)